MKNDANLLMEDYRSQKSLISKIQNFELRIVSPFGSWEVALMDIVVNFLIKVNTSTGSAMCSKTKLDNMRSILPCQCLGTT